MANEAVIASDVIQTKSRVGQQVEIIGFRSDVSAHTYIDAADVSRVKN